MSTRIPTSLLLPAAAISLGACSMAAMDGGMSDRGGMKADAMGSGSMGGSVMVGAAAMYPNRNIVQNAMNSRDHTTLVAAVKAASLVDTLSGPGPFTVFAPTNAAFDRLPAGTVQTLLRPENKTKLTQVLTYHVVPGRLTAQDLMQQIQAGGGQAVLTTVQGEPLTVTQDGRSVRVRDSKGDVATVTIPNVMQSNGVVHVVDTVLMP